MSAGQWTGCETRLETPGRSAALCQKGAGMSVSTVNGSGTSGKVVVGVDDGSENLFLLQSILKHAG